MNDELIEMFKRYHEIYAQEEDEKLVRLAAETAKNLLKHILMKYMVRSSLKKDELFSSERPLRHFNAMIHLAYRLGLISEGLADEIQLVRKMRKQFVRTVDCLTLDYKDAQALCDRLNAPAQIKSKSLYIKEKFPDTARGNFELTATILSCLLENILNKIEKTQNVPLH